ncbi:hypothetical protein MettiDRAFT_2634 [Methanolobus tindarius DSM 2278]|uniref:Uncharacterized protein n=1 Tax=Methanolobus tindarius DSM 2278 TaxID=1090322 RepID=W9DU50_METTI|nr:hypothetical protein [Methanolobus tindarius]ETA69140.1 hypothetical protein MettiDRAFT_2634 [Methanolobus tindarius DSM 2278]
MSRASIITLDESGTPVSREVDNATYDDETGFLYVHGKEAYQVDEVINMRSPTFCAVRFLREEARRAIA